MKVKKLTCQTCGANLEVKDNIAFCSYCGAQLVLDDENRTTTHNYNYNYTHTKRDEARIRENERKEKVRLTELEYEERKEKRDNKIGLICGLGIPLFIILAILLGFGINKWSSQAQGKICAGYYKDYIGESYEAVVEQFEEMGFENIVTVDLEDSGIAFWNDGKVKSVTIDGNDSFESINYFYPDDKVIIKYH
ncbi:MAG: zinc ribbon domain-containing protein [Ruminococcaceae bacterium]|nr:zinc ribbon domain-containing protein [Oscillospiraceae bacterium]